IQPGNVTELNLGRRLERHTDPTAFACGAGDAHGTERHRHAGVGGQMLQVDENLRRVFFWKREVDVEPAVAVVRLAIADGFARDRDHVVALGYRNGQTANRVAENVELETVFYAHTVFFNRNQTQDVRVHFGRAPIFFRNGRGPREAQTVLHGKNG